LKGGSFLAIIWLYFAAYYGLHSVIYLAPEKGLYM
jgi:hypothetical protein